MCENITLGNFTVQYGKTTVQELVNIGGYTISDLIQASKESASVTCNLYKKKRFIAILMWHSTKEEVTIEQLLSMPIEHVIPYEAAPDEASKKDYSSRYSLFNYAKSRSFPNKMMWTGLIHIITAIAYFCICIIPWLHSLFKMTFTHGIRPSLISAALVLLPIIFIAYIWGKGTVNTEGNVLRKILFSLWLILNYALLITYMVVIYMHFYK